MNKGFNLIDGQKCHKAHPLTFKLPSKKDIKNLLLGDFVKIGVEGNFTSKISGERFWVRVTDVGTDIGGLVEQADMLFHRQHGIEHASKIKFKGKHILAILKQHGAN